MENLFKEYAELTQSIKAMDSRKKLISKEIMEKYSKDLQANPDLGKQGYGTFKVYESQPNWEYSSALVDALDSIKEAQLDEQEQGIATKHPTISLRFNPAGE